MCAMSFLRWEVSTFTIFYTQDTEARGGSVSKLSSKDMNSVPLAHEAVWLGLCCLLQRHENNLTSDLVSA